MNSPPRQRKRLLLTYCSGFQLLEAKFEMHQQTRLLIVSTQPMTFASLRLTVLSHTFFLIKMAGSVAPRS